MAPVMQFTRLPALPASPPTMQTCHPEIVVLTPRVGMLNHRYVVAENSPLDASACGRIYRSAKDALAEAAAGCGRLGDGGGFFIAARHVVTQHEAAGRRGAEWLIVVDQRIGGLDDDARDSLQRELAERLFKLSVEVLDGVPWEKHAGSDVIHHAALSRWRQEIGERFSAVPLEKWQVTTGPARPPLDFGAMFLGKAAMFAALVAGAIVLWQSFRPPPPPPAKVIEQAERVLGVQGGESAVKARIAVLFREPRALAEKSTADMLRELWRATSGQDGTERDLCEDEAFWDALRNALPPGSKQPDLYAFVQSEDKQLLSGIPEPETFVRKLADRARAVGEMVSNEKFGDEDLDALFKSIQSRRESLRPEGAEESLVVFTRADVTLARELIKIFQDDDVRKVIERIHAQVGDRDSLGAWMTAIVGHGAANAHVFSTEYFDSQIKAAVQKQSKRRQECLKHLRDFCATCTELTRQPRAADPARMALPDARQPRAESPGR